MEYITKVWSNSYLKYYRYLKNLNILKKLSLSVIFALLTGLSTNFYIRLPFTPVPFTGQVFMVLLIGVLLGKNFGTISQTIYLIGGSLGVNWFYSTQSGFFRHTTGYLIGFIVATYFIGLLTEKKTSYTSILTAMIFGVFLILILGTLWLSCFLHISLPKAFLIGFFPFLPFDILKAYFASIAASLILKNK